MIQAIVLDIEGTTCPVDFVSKTLFPFAQEHLEATLAKRMHESEIDSLVNNVIHEWMHDSDPISHRLWKQLKKKPPSIKDIEAYLGYLIESDRKSTALKDLQGMVWKQGYQSGQLKSSLFRDVRPQLDNWKREGKVLAVYSSGSIQAQKLLYRHTDEGDLTHYFDHWFDTHTGPKLVPESYKIIAQTLGFPASQVLFVSDHPVECDAAQQAGLHAVFCLRNRNPHQNPGVHPVARQFSDIDVDSIPDPQS